MNQMCWKWMNSFVRKTVSLTQWPQNVMWHNISCDITCHVTKYVMWHHNTYFFHWAGSIEVIDCQKTIQVSCPTFRSADLSSLRITLVLEILETILQHLVNPKMAQSDNFRLKVSKTRSSNDLRLSLVNISLNLEEKPYQYQECERRGFENLFPTSGLEILKF